MGKTDVPAAATPASEGVVPAAKPLPWASAWASARGTAPAATARSLVRSLPVRPCGREQSMRSQLRRRGRGPAAWVVRQGGRTACNRMTLNGVQVWDAHGSSAHGSSTAGSGKPSGQRDLSGRHACRSLSFTIPGGTPSFRNAGGDRHVPSYSSDRRPSPHCASCTCMNLSRLQARQNLAGSTTSR
eukprot:352199-Chlamydomonas_euryale.AAC.2